jgi:hypothetical protein
MNRAIVQLSAAANKFESWFPSFSPGISRLFQRPWFLSKFRNSGSSRVASLFFNLGAVRLLQDVNIAFKAGACIRSHYPQFISIGIPLVTVPGDILSHREFLIVYKILDFPCESLYCASNSEPWWAIPNSLF